jgi:hypothetical protein
MGSIVKKLDLELDSKVESELWLELKSELNANLHLELWVELNSEINQMIEHGLHKKRN